MLLAALVVVVHLIVVVVDVEVVELGLLLPLELDWDRAHRFCATESTIGHRVDSTLTRVLAFSPTTLRVSATLRILDWI